MSVRGLVGRLRGKEEELPLGECPALAAASSFWAVAGRTFVTKATYCRYCMCQALGPVPAFQVGETHEAKVMACASVEVCRRH